jgi:hypothetical protein
MSETTVQRRSGDTFLVARLPVGPAVPSVVDVAALVDRFAVAEDLLNEIVTAIGNAKEAEGTSRSVDAEQRLFSLVEDLALGYGVVVA